MYVHQKDVFRNNVGYCSRQKASLIALEWLKWLEIANDLDLQYKGKGVTGKEHRIGRYVVDGYDPANKRIYEMYGCYW